MVALITLASGKSAYAEIHRRDATQRRPDIPLIFIPGFLNTTVTFTPLLPYFTGYTRILYDMEGHGHTPAGPAPITIASLAQDTRDVLAHFGYTPSPATPAIIVGHSAGAIIALQYAHQFPGAVAKLILMGPLELPLPREQMIFNAGLVRGMPMDAMVTYVSQWLSPQGRADPRVAGLVRAETERHDAVREGAARHMEAVAEYEFADVGDVQTWVVRGKEDAVSPESATLSICARVPGVKVITLDRGHYFTWENLDGIVGALRSILDE